MAVGGFTKTTYDAALLEVVNKSRIQEAVNRSNAGHERMVNRAGKWEGKEGKFVETPLITAGGEGGGTIGETDAMPTPDSHDITRARWFACHDYERRRLTGVVLDASASSKQALKEALAETMRNARKDMANRWNWQLCRGDGSALIASVTASNTGLVLTVDDTSQFRVNQQVTLAVRTSGAYPAATATKAHFTIFSIDTATQITLANVTGGVSPANGEVDSTFGVYFRRGRANAPFGFEAMCSASNPSNQGARYVGNINRTTNPYWQGFEVDAQNELISLEDNIDPVVDEVNNRCGEYPTSAWMHYEQWNKIGHELREFVRYQGPQKRTKAGFAYLEYNDMELFKDRHIRRDRCFFVNDDNIGRYVLAATTLLDRGNGYLQPVTDSEGDKDLWVFTMVTRHAWAAMNPLSCGMLKNLAVG